MDFRDVTVLCVGDVMLDRYVHGEVDRISPEAPIPVIRLTRTEEMLGGAGNVANNVAALGGQALLVGLVGRDSAGEAMSRLGRAVARIDVHLVQTADRPTICKTRFVAARQQVVRADEESQLPLQPREEADLLRSIERLLPEATAVILSDYGKGALTETVLRRVIKDASAAGKPVFIDPKRKEYDCYHGATCITPNMKELALVSAMPVDTDAEVEAAARQVMARSGVESVLATRSERGMMLVCRDAPAISVPALAREVFDVSGAGDTVIATLALAHASGLSFEQAMHIANAAAGVVVSKLGTATATVEEVVHELENQDNASSPELLGVSPLSVTAAMVARWKTQGLRVGFTNGCFDIMHPGHISLLKAARASCDRLVVALNVDASVRRLKGPTRPVNDLSQRAQVMAAVRYVDCVTSFDESTPLRLIQRLRPDVLIKGADYRLDQVVGADVVQAYGGEVVLASLIPGQSTTAILERSRQPVELVG